MDELPMHSVAGVLKFSKYTEAIWNTLDSEEWHKRSSKPEI